MPTATPAAKAARTEVSISTSLQVPYTCGLSRSGVKKLVADYIDPDDKDDLEGVLETYLECVIQDALLEYLLEALPSVIELDTPDGPFTLKINGQEVMVLLISFS